MSNRTYSSVPNDSKGSASFPQIYDPSLILTGGNKLLTGGWRPYTTADISTSNVSISGGVSVGNVSVTGGQISVIGGSITVTNTAPLPISGVVQAQFSDTGNRSVQVVNTAPIPVSGVIVAPNGLIGIDTGNRSVNIVNTAPLAISGAIQGGNLVPLYVTGAILSIVTGSVSTSVNAVAITGAPIISLTGQLPVFVVNQAFVNSGGWVGVTGLYSIAVTGGSILNVETGNRSVSIVNTAPLAISGVVNTTVTLGPIAVTGFNSTIAPLAVSGSFSATVQSVAVTGFPATIAPLAVSGAVLDSLGWALLSGISGQLSANLAGSAPITGDIRNIPGTVLAISGFVNTIVTGAVNVNNPIGITGTTRDLNPAFSGINSYPALWIAGRAVNVSGVGSATGYRTGDAVVLSMNASDGSLLVTQGRLDQASDNVTSWAASTGTAAATTVSGQTTPSWGLILPANTNRRAAWVQNLSTGVMYLSFNPTPSSGSCNVVLAPGTAQSDGRGGVWNDRPSIYQGALYLTGYFTIGANWLAWQL